MKKNTRSGSYGYPFRQALDFSEDGFYDADIGNAIPGRKDNSEEMYSG